MREERGLELERDGVQSSAWSARSQADVGACQMATVVV